MNAKRSLEESLDVFASTSSEAENNTNVTPPPKVKTIDLSISDDSDTDQMLVAATDRACETLTPSKKPDKQSTATTAKHGSPNVSKPRQRTLLEMLDQTYNQITGPATKRYCVTKSPQKP